MTQALRRIIDTNSWTIRNAIDRSFCRSFASAAGIKRRVFSDNPCLILFIKIFKTNCEQIMILAEATQWKYFNDLWGIRKQMKWNRTKMEDDLSIRPLKSRAEKITPCSCDNFQARMQQKITRNISQSLYRSSSCKNSIQLLLHFQMDFTFKSIHHDFERDEMH